MLTHNQSMFYSHGTLPSHTNHYLLFLPLKHLPRLYVDFPNNTY